MKRTDFLKRSLGVMLTPALLKTPDTLLPMSPKNLTTTLPSYEFAHGWCGSVASYPVIFDAEAAKRWRELQQPVPLLQLRRRLLGPVGHLP